jgi:hypothetical protein
VTADPIRRHVAVEKVESIRVTGRSHLLIELEPAAPDCSRYAPGG